MGVVFSAQMYSVLAVDRHGTPLSNSLTWSDTRSAALAADVRHQAGSDLTQTGCPIQAIYPLAKILWLTQTLNLPPDVKFVSIKDYVLFRLTGQFLTDWSIASASGLLHIADHRWDNTALSITRTTPSNLPDLHSPRHINTHWQPDILRHIGLPGGTPLILGAGDAPLANIGVGAIGPETLAINLGTSAAARVLIPTPQVDPSGRLWTYVADEDYWVMGGIIGSGGAVYDWLLSKHIFPNQALGLERLYAEADQLAAGVEPGAEGLMFLPYFSGEQSPGWNPDARGAIYGLSFHHEPKHYIRAALEGIAFSLRRVVSAIEEIREETANKIYLTGGLTASSVCLKIITHVFGASVVVPPSSESSARGAAIVGWLALGHGQDYSTFYPTAAQQEASLTPDADLHTLYQQKYATFCALNDRLHDAL
jgi:gluconokinase